MNKQNEVYKPTHYTNGLPCEAIDIIESVTANLHQQGYKPFVVWGVGNALKYILRAGKKDDDAIEDLMKAKNYLHRAIYGVWENSPMKIADPVLDDLFEKNVNK